MNHYIIDILADDLPTALELIASTVLDPKFPRDRLPSHKGENATFTGADFSAVITYCCLDQKKDLNS